MAERPFDVKQYQSYPDDFDIIKVDSGLTTGSIIKAGSIFQVKSIGTPTAFTGLVDESIYTAAQDYTLLAGDTAILLGYERNYAGILCITVPTFPNDDTSIVIAGVGKNLSNLNTALANTFIYGWFNKIQLAAGNTTTIIVAYK